VESEKLRLINANSFIFSENHNQKLRDICSQLALPAYIYVITVQCPMKEPFRYGQLTSLLQLHAIVHKVKATFRKRKYASTCGRILSHLKPMV
jgi:hypothetical protein